MDAREPVQVVGRHIRHVEIAVELPTRGREVRVDLHAENAAFAGGAHRNDHQRRGWHRRGVHVVKLDGTGLFGDDHQMVVEEPEVGRLGKARDDGGAVEIHRRRLHPLGARGQLVVELRSNSRNRLHHSADRRYCEHLLHLPAHPAEHHQRQRVSADGSGVVGGKIAEIVALTASIVLTTTLQAHATTSRAASGTVAGLTAALATSTGIERSRDGLGVARPAREGGDAAAVLRAVLTVRMATVGAECCSIRAGALVFSPGWELAEDEFARESTDFVDAEVPAPSAHAGAGLLTIAPPTPNVTARTPTRPMNFVYWAVRSAIMAPRGIGDPARRGLQRPDNGLPHGPS